VPSSGNPQQQRLKPSSTRHPASSVGSIDFTVGDIFAVSYAGAF
jgi:hypothetical protein